MKYVYPATFTKEYCGYSVNFPDIPNCFTCGETIEEAVIMAEDALSIVLYENYEKLGKDVPIFSEVSDIVIDENTFINYIVCDTEFYKKIDNKRKAVRKNVTIPEWLNDEAASAGINCSQVLQDALRKELGYLK